jgi:hypothetical protein
VEKGLCGVGVIPDIAPPLPTPGPVSFLFVFIFYFFNFDFFILNLVNIFNFSKKLLFFFFKDIFNEYIWI